MARKLLDGTANMLALIASVALVLMMLHIAVSVVMRWVFNVSLHATIEIVSTYYMVAVVFLPLALVERLNAHINVELLTQHFPHRVQMLLIAVVGLVSASYFGAFAWQTWGDALQKYAVGEVMLGNVPVTVWPTRFYVPVGCAVIVLLLLYKSIRIFAGDESVLERGNAIDMRE